MTMDKLSNQAREITTNFYTCDLLQITEVQRQKHEQNRDSLISSAMISSSGLTFLLTLTLAR